jgi:hypothetical protein
VVNRLREWAIDSCLAADCHRSRNQAISVMVLVGAHSIFVTQTA